MPWYNSKFIRPAHVDKNQKAIRRALEIAGAEVEDLSSVGRGCPDLLVGIGATLILVEVKKPLGPRGGLRGGGLTPHQIAWRQRREKWPVYTVRDVDHALALVAAIKAHGAEAGRRG